MEGDQICHVCGPAKGHPPCTVYMTGQGGISEGFQQTQAFFGEASGFPPDNLNVCRLHKRQRGRWGGALLLRTAYSNHDPGRPGCFYGAHKALLLLFQRRLENLDWGCQGVYICRASSSSGEAQDRARLTIQGKWGCAAGGLGSLDCPTDRQFLCSKNSAVAWLLQKRLCAALAWHGIQGSA